MKAATFGRHETLKVIIDAGAELNIIANVSMASKSNTTVFSVFWWTISLYL